MTVQSTNNRTDTIADGIQTVFVYDYYLINAAHMTVLFDAVDQPTGWTVSGVGDPGGGNVTFDVAPADGVRVTLLRVVPLTQEIDYTEYDPFPAEVAETALDLEVMRDQQGVEVNSRNLSFSINDLPSGGSELATPQASFAIGYDAFGNLTNLDVGGGEGSGVRNPLVADLFGGGFDIIMQDAPLGTVTITIDGPTGVIDATDVTVPNGSVDTHIGTANIHFADAAADGKQYVRQDSAWTEVDVPPGTIISDTPPVSPVDGQTWFESDTGVEWIWYDDGVGTPSGQWVETGPSPVGLEGGGGGDGNVTAPAGGTTTGFITTYANDAGTFLDTGLPTSTFLTPAQGDAAYDSLGSAAGVQTNLTTHENAADPHPQYLTPAEGDAAYTPLTLINNGEILFYNTGAHQKLGIGTQDQVLTVKSGIPSWENAAGGAGEANTSSNAGAGEGLALAKSGVDLPFKSLVAGTNITLTPGADTVTITASGGGGGNVVGTPDGNSTGELAVFSDAAATAITNAPSLIATQVVTNDGTGVSGNIPQFGANATDIEDSGIAASSLASFPGMGIQFGLDAGANQEYTLDEYAGFAYTIDEAVYKTASGTITANVRINGTSITGLAALAVTSTQGGPTAATALNTVAVGDKVTVLLSADATAVDLSIKLNGTKT